MGWLKGDALKKGTGLAWVVAVLGFLAVGLQAAALASSYFQPNLDSDYLYPQRFVEDLCQGVYPLSGWSLSSSSYFFPDFLLCFLLRALGFGAVLLPTAVVVNYLLLALAGSVAARGSGLGRLESALAGSLAVNLLLATRGFGDGARWLWWLGVPGFHGAAVGMGLVLYGLWAEQGDSGPLTRRYAAGLCVCVLGIASDSLLLTQAVLAMGLVWIACAGSVERRRRIAERLGAAVLAAFAASVLLRFVSHELGLWSFAGVFRYAPTPSALASAASRMAADLAGPIWQHQGVIELLSAVGLAFAGAALWGLFPVEPAARRFLGFVAASSAATLLFPIVAAYWRNPQHGRYLLPLMVLPLLGLGVVLVGRFLAGPRRLVLAATGAVFCMGVAWAALNVKPASWQMPYPDRVAALDRFLVARGLDTGLADFWHARLLQSESHALVHLQQVLADGRVQFWDNNAFHHFKCDSQGRLIPRSYQFVLTDGLDEQALLAAFGVPDDRVKAGGFTLWIYGRTAGARLNESVDSQVRGFVQGRRGSDRVVGISP